jgi:hypothetical protein
MVFKGELIYLEWFSILDTNVQAALTYSNGKSMVHMPSSFPFSKYTSLGQIMVAMAFNKINPW